MEPKANNVVASGIGQPEKVWFADFESWRPIQVVCPRGMVPSLMDAHGNIIHQSTHFASYKECVEALKGRALVAIQLAQSRRHALLQELKAHEDVILNASRTLVEEDLGADTP